MTSGLVEDAAVETLASRAVDIGAIVIIVVAALAMAATLPGRTFGLGLVTKPLMQDLQLTETDWAHVNLAATLIGALFCFPAGRLLDLYGAPKVLLGTLVALGLTTSALGRTNDYYVLLALVTLTRGFGQGALSVVSIALVGKSFRRGLSWPMATYSVLMSIAFIFAFQTVGYFIKQPDISWRQVWMGMGLVLVAVGPLGWLALRGCNLQARMTAAATADVNASKQGGFTLFEALATPAFWVFAGATSLFGLAASGLALYNLPLLEERKLTLQDFLNLQLVTTPLGLAGQACCGLLARYVSYQRILAVAMFLYAAGLFGLSRITSPEEMYGYGAVIGLSGGMITVIFFAVWGGVFGLRELGRIQGAAQMTTVFASAIGPELFGVAKSYYHSYMPAIYVLAPAVVAFGAAAWFTPLPRKPAADGFPVGSASS